MTTWDNGISHDGNVKIEDSEIYTSANLMVKSKGGTLKVMESYFECTSGCDVDISTEGDGNVKVRENNFGPGIINIFVTTEFGELKFQRNNGDIIGNLTIESEEDGNIQVDRNGTVDPPNDPLDVGGTLIVNAMDGSAKVFGNNFGGLGTATISAAESCKSFGNLPALVNATTATVCP